MGSFLNKIVTILIVQLVNIRYTGELFGLMRNIKSELNNYSKARREKNLKNYLEKWGYGNELFKDIKPMTKADIREYNKKTPDSKVHKVFLTGGSTGEPLKLLYSKRRAVLRTASILYYNKLAGYNIGDRYLFIRSKPKSSLFQILRNEILFVPNDFSNKRIEELSHTLVDKRVKVIIGYPSVIYEIALFLSDRPQISEKIKITTFISGAEPLDKHVRDLIKSVLKCNIIDRYSNEENGMIAQQHFFGGDLIVDRFNLYVEVVDPVTLIPVKAGEMGKVLVTDIYSDLSPMIRYDTGDFAVVSEYRDGELYSLKNINGRIIDQFETTKGVRFSPLILGPHIRIPLTELSFQVQFQFIQQSNIQFRLLLKAENDSISKEKLDTVVDGLKKVIGKNSTIDIEFVKDIPALKSGKRPLYRNLMGKSIKNV